MRRWIGFVAIGVAIVGIVLVVGLWIEASRLQGVIRSRALHTLETHFHGSVKYDALDVALFPRARVTIRGLVVRHNARTDLPPLIEAQKIEVEASLMGLLLPHPHVKRVYLYGLQIHTPPRVPGGKPMIQPTEQDLAKKYPVLVEDIHADDVVLTVLRSDTSKPPREFDIHHLEMKDFSFDRPAAFTAMLTNPVPRGEIVSSGKFGPWQGDEPSSTPLNASFTFDHADMSTLKGLSGFLSSKGSYGGPLDYLHVDGETDTPDFALRTAKHPLDLHTDYTAIVDGTNGNTYLKKVAAKFLNTEIDASGEVVGVEGEKGRQIELDAVADDARIEDILRLVVSSDEPLMTGAVKLKTKILIPPGNDGANGDLLDRLKLDGQFGVVEARFTSPETQDKIDSLSRRGQGRPKDTDVDNEVSALQGAFTVDNSVVKFSSLSFRVTGAAIRLAGTYNLDSGALDFHGHLKMDAKLSQTTTGVRSFFLKAVDPFFKGKNGGTDLPIKITGTKDHPAFGLDLHDKSNPK
ncbi:MAG: AsmA-like C-terminal region-containing protein [Candidatus Acidiferrales bacterium]